MAIQKSILGQQSITKKISNMTIYLIRHGETTGDIEDRFGGDYEDHLTEKGQEQSRQLSEKLADKGIETIFSSPKIRAQETARILNQKLNIEIETVEDIRERNHYGVMTGMIKTEARKEYPDLIKLLSDTRNTIKGGEDYYGFGQRIEKGLEKITTSNHKTVAVVSHGGPIRYFFREIMGKGEIKIGDCAFAELETQGKNLKIISLDGVILQNE